jgi:two-component system, OmpR family, sensor histidine kinase VicK
MSARPERNSLLQDHAAPVLPTALSPASAAMLFEHAPLGLAIVDGTTYEMLYGNSYLSRILEATPETGRSLRLADRLPRPLGATIEALVENVLRTNQPLTRKHVVSISAAGERRTWDVSVAPLHVDAVDTPRVLLHIADMTGIESDGELAENIRAFERIKEDFLAVTAHELRTPVTALLGYTNLMVSRAERGDWTDRDLHALRMIQAQAKRLTQLINGLVDVARIQTGEVELRYQQVDVAGLVQRVVREFRLTAGDYTIEATVPPEPVLIWGDAQRIEQVVAQLLDNALKYSPWGGTIQVNVWAETEAHLAIVDQGIGIPEEELPHLFERFYRASNTDSDRISGLGIGLYLAREFVTAHQGQIDVRSVPNQQTVFEITLPLAGEDASGVR